MNNELILSIIVPIYNKADFLPALFRSIMEQDLLSNEFEIIFIDDGSTDLSGIICSNFKEKHPEINITYIYQENSGVSSARNHGISLAKGKYLLFMDSDDILARGGISYLLKNLSVREPDYIGFGMKQLDIRKNNHSNESNEEYFSEERTQIVNGCKLIQATSWPSSCCVGLYKAQFIRDNDIKFPTNVAIGEDCCFNLRFFLKKPICVLTSAKIYIYLFRGESIMTSLSRKSAGKRFDSYYYLLCHIRNACLEYPVFADALNRVFIHHLEVFIPQVLQLNLSYREFEQYADKFIKEKIVPIEYKSQKCKIANLIFMHPFVYPILSTFYSYIFYPLYKGVRNLKYLVKPSNMCFEWTPLPVDKC